MVRVLFLAPIVALVSVGVYLLQVKTPERPDMKIDAWWGPDSLKQKQDDSIRPMKLKFKQSMVQDLQQYLKTTRTFHPPLEGVTFEYGFDTRQLNSWLQYWAKDYDFAARENFLNQFPSYRTLIQGLSIHFLHVKPEVPKGTDVIPVLLLHGWPGSVREFYEAIPLLTAVQEGRDFALEVIVPSLPGYGFSDAAVRPGLGAAEVAVVMRNLMQRLGYSRFYVQGGDWGSIIASHMATLFPEEVLGYHTNCPINMAPSTSFLELVFSYWPTLIVEPELVERMYPLSSRFSHLIQESGYLHIQATKPDTVGVALSDSPAGLLAYILEKFITWTDKSLLTSSDGGLLEKFSKDKLLDNIMMYWSTQSITTSMRLYSETFNKRHLALQLDSIPTSVPTWCLQAKHEISYQPPALLQRKYTNLLHCTVLDDGGHFLALQLPKEFSEDVLKAIKAFREWHRSRKE